MFGGPWDSTLIMKGVPSSKMVSHLFIYGPSVKGFEQALAVKQVSQNIKAFSYLNLLYRPNQLDRNFRSLLGQVFEMIQTYLTLNSR